MHSCRATLRTLILLSMAFGLAVPPPTAGQGQTLSPQPDAYQAHLKIGPVADLTTDWYASPRRSALPLGATVRFRIENSRDYHVAWTGAREVERRGSWSIAEARFLSPGPQVVGVRYTDPYGEKIEEVSTFEVIDLAVHPLRISPIVLTADPLVFDGADPNPDSMRYFFQGSSIAPLRRLAEGHYLTSVNRWMEASVEVEPTAFAPLLEWRLNGQAQTALGAPLRLRTFPPGVHRLSVGNLQQERNAQLETYLVRITSHKTDDAIPDGVPVTFTAVTQPAGYEEHITWLASTKYGHCAPLLGKGASFTTVFDATFGEGGRWLGVRADNASVAIDSKSQLDLTDYLEARTDGTFGFYLRRVDGPVLLALNEDFEAYAASTIKVLHHLHAVRGLPNEMALDTVPLLVCSESESFRTCTRCSSACRTHGTTSGLNCGNNPNTTVPACDATPQSLRCALERMMLVSSNKSPNTLQEFFGGGNPEAGRAALNATADAVVGIGNRLKVTHKFLCNLPPVPPFNTITLEDLGILYDKVANDPTVLTDEQRDIFYRLMFSETNSSQASTIRTLIDEEAADLSIPPPPAVVTAFKEDFRLAYKNGRSDTVDSSGDPHLYASLAGWVEIPFYCGAVTRQYVFGYFIHDAATNTTSESEIVRRLLRRQIRTALATSLTCLP